MKDSIQCINVYESITFGVSKNNFPVYIKDNIYNTNPDFDYGAFVLL